MLNAIACGPRPPRSSPTGDRKRGVSESHCLAVNSFAGLYTYDTSGKTVPDCAESYTVSADGLTYTVKLKSGPEYSRSASRFTRIVASSP